MNANAPVDPQLVGALLEATARARDVTNYGRIAERFGLPPFDGIWTNHPLAAIFEVLDQQDAAAQRPFRTSVVIAVGSNGPGPGFFEALNRLKNIPDPRTPRARDELWARELNAAYAYPWPR